MPAALLGRVLAVAGVVILVLSPAAAVATAGRDAIGQEREPYAVDRADDDAAAAVGGRHLAVMRQSDQPSTFSGRPGPALPISTARTGRRT
jgi:hypothetical protein